MTRRGSRWLVGLGFRQIRPTDRLRHRFHRERHLSKLRTLEYRACDFVGLYSPYSERLPLSAFVTARPGSWAEPVPFSAAGIASLPAVATNDTGSVTAREPPLRPTCPEALRDGSLRLGRRWRLPPLDASGQAAPAKGASATNDTEAVPTYSQVGIASGSPKAGEPSQ